MKEKEKKDKKINEYRFILHEHSINLLLFD